MQDRIKEHDWDIRLARTKTSAVSEHAHNTAHKPLWNEVKFIDRDPYYYTRRVKEAIHIRLHPNNINRDSGIEIPEAWMPTIKKHNNRRAVRQRTAEGANHWVNSKDRNAPIRAVEKQLITAEHHALQDHAWPVDLIAWRRLAVYSRNVAIYITRDYIVRQTKNLALIFSIDFVLDSFKIIVLVVDQFMISSISICRSSEMPLGAF